MSHERLYDAAVLKQLFDEMQSSYERISNICSFGFNRLWRKQCVKLAQLKPGMVVCDMMTGTGESWMYILSHLGESGRLYSIDFSPVMIQHAKQRQSKLTQYQTHLLEEDALQCSLANDSVDSVISTYGVKTLAPDLREGFAAEIHRILKPGGTFALVEISLPQNPVLQWAYYQYLKYVIPVIGMLCLGNHDNYRQLSEYLIRFKGCQVLLPVFEAQGFTVTSEPLFFGCATVLLGHKPMPGN